MGEINNNRNPQQTLDLLDRMSVMGPGVIRIGNDGVVVGDGGMTLRSGLHRHFGRQVSEDDVKVNKHTLAFVLNSIRTNMGEGVGDQVMESTLKLGGDNKETNYTVKDRFERGTYVTPKLVAELRLLTLQAMARDVVQGNDELCRDFFARPSEDVPSPFQSFVEEIYEGNYPKDRLITSDKELDQWQSDKENWQAFREYFRNGEGCGLVREEAMRRAQIGEAMTLDDVKHLARDYMYGKFLDDGVRLSDYTPKLFENLTVSDIAQAVREWPIRMQMTEPWGRQAALDLAKRLESGEKGENVEDRRLLKGLKTHLSQEHGKLNQPDRLYRTEDVAGLFDHVLIRYFLKRQAEGRS